MIAVNDIEIVPFNETLKPWFGELNRIWLKRYFEVEPIDRRVLDNPEEHILDHGGQILFAVRGDEVLGTCALKYHGGDNYELTKMAVADSAQGQGIGRLLLKACIARYRELRGARLFLESHDSLRPALKLYETGGFEHAPSPDETSPYARSNIYMVFKE